MKLLAIFLFPLLALGQTVQINQGTQTSKGIAPLTTGLTSINGDTTPAQTIQGAGTVSVSTTAGVTTVTGTGGGGPLNAATAYSSAEHGWAGTLSVGYSVSAGNVAANHFHYANPYTTTFDTIYGVMASGADPSNTTAVAIWDVSSSPQSMLCHSLAKNLTAGVNGFACVEGLRVLNPGHDYVFLRASSGTVATILGTSAGQTLTRYGSTNVVSTCPFDPANGIANCTSGFTLGAYTSAVNAPSFFVATMTPGTPTTVNATGYSAFVHGWNAAAAIVLSNTGFLLPAVHFRYGVPYNTTFSNVYLVISTADSGTVSAVAIWDVSASPQTMVCHSYPVTATLGAAQFPCSEGTVSLLAGHDYLFIRASTSPTTAAWGANYTTFATRYYNTNIPGCSFSSASNGGITCNPGTSFTLQPSYYSGPVGGVPMFRLE